ncbi:MAG: ABC transporter permease [Tissierellia bacterium]|nr:ABC transporter permease [Tissierellia bacterium]
MMKKLKALIITDLNTSFGLSAFKYKFKDKKEATRMVILFIALLSLLPTYIMLIKGLKELYLAYNHIGQGPAFLLNGFVYSQIIVLIFGIIFIMSKYYFANDLNILVPLPIEAKNIIGAKFITAMISEYLTIFPIILPFIFIYGINGKEGLLYWLYSLILIFFIPIIPLALVSIIIMLFMRFTNIKGKKDQLRVIGYILLLIILLGFQFKIQSLAQDSLLQGEDFFLSLAEDSNLLVRKIGMFFPWAMWGTLALSSAYSISGLLNIILFIGSSILVFFITLGLSEKLFFKGLIGNLEVNRSKSKEVHIKDYSKPRPSFLAIGLKEIKMLFRTPIYLMNSVMGVIIIPIIFLMSYYMDGGTFDGRFDGILEGHIVSIMGAGMIIFLSGINGVGSTTFSREGKNFWLQRVLPIKVKDQIFGRILAALIIQIIGIIALLVSFYFMIKLSLENIFWITFLGLLGSIVMTEIGMIVDIFRPMLNWDNPQKVMKQNLNVLITMGISMLYLLGLGFLVNKLMSMDKGISIVYGVPILIFIISAYVFYILLEKLIHRQMRVME